MNSSTLSNSVRRGTYWCFVSVRDIDFRHEVPNGLQAALSVVLAAVFLSPFWKFVVIASAVALFLWQLFGSAQESGERRVQRYKLDELHAHMLEDKASRQIDGSRREANQLSAELLRFLVRRESERPSAESALAAAGRERWMPVFFSNAGKYYRDCASEYKDVYGDRVREIAARFGGDQVIDEINNAPALLWPDGVRIISERLAELGNSKNESL